MYHIKNKNRSLFVILFIIFVGVYLFLSVGNPLLHNHHEASEHHHNCPACEFLAVAFLFDVPEVDAISVFLWQTNCVIILENQYFSQESHRQSSPSRAPPTSF